MKIKISTDSTSDIPKEFWERLNISVLPLTIHYEDKEYLDGVDITPEEIYHILDTAKTLPASSQVALPLYTELFENTWEQGYTDQIHITLNGKGSGTYQAAMLAKDMFFEAHPEAEGSFIIHILDSRTYSMAYGIPVVEAAQMAQSGAGVEEILAHLTDWLEHTRPLFVPLDLKCVKKSGRISPAAPLKMVKQRSSPRQEGRRRHWQCFWRPSRRNAAPALTMYWFTAAMRKSFSACGRSVPKLPISLP